MIVSGKILTKKKTIGYLKMFLLKEIKYYYAEYGYLFAWNS